jgi:hypothetical protein
LVITTNSGRIIICKEKLAAQILFFSLNVSVLFETPCVADGKVQL